MPWNHPRRRGDFPGGSPRCGAHRESPPQARGLLSDDSRRPVAHGITPAGAGTSRRSRWPCSASRNHPRRRGDFEYIDARPVPVKESPPLARGLRPFPAWCRRGAGITPAGAGTSGTCWLSVPPEWNHPRRRGDFSPSPPPMRRFPESPRQARGLLFLVDLLGDDRGITPAGAGTSQLRTARRSCRRNHPRRRGDFPPNADDTPPSRESPPQARGLLDRGCGALGADGITPAGAGTSWSVVRRRSFPGNHPRRRGDFVSSPSPSGQPSESPPQARGLRRRRSRERRARGITPAGAGTSGCG